MKIYTKTFLVLLLLTFSVTAAFAQQDGKTPPKEGKQPIVKVENKKDNEERERQKQEEKKRNENKKPQ